MPLASRVPWKRGCHRAIRRVEPKDGLFSACIARRKRTKQLAALFDGDHAMHSSASPVRQALVAHFGSGSGSEHTGAFRGNDPGCRGLDHLRGAASVPAPQPGGHLVLTTTTARIDASGVLEAVWLTAGDSAESETRVMRVSLRKIVKRLGRRTSGKLS